MLKIITGRACSGKTSYIIDEIMKNEKEHSLSYLMTPEQLTLETEKMLINIIKKPLFLCKVMSFERFSTEVMLKAGGTKRKYIDEIGKLMLLENILLENKDEFKIYKNAVNKTGFLEAVIQIITEFKKNDISSTKLFEISKNLQDNSLLSLKLSEISKMYTYFENKTADKFIDNESRLNLICEKINYYSKLKNYNVYFDNYVSFTALELKVIQTLLENNIDISISLPYDKDDTSFDTTDLTMKSLLKTAKIADVGYKIINLDNKYKQSKELSHLEENFGKLDFKKYADKPKDISLKYFDKAKTEVMFLANEIKSLIKSGYRYKDISVVVTEDINYPYIIKEAFELYDIPYFIDNKRPVTQENIISFVFSFLDMMTSGLNYNNIMSFLKTEMTDIKKREYEIFENYMLKWNMNERKYISEKYFSEEKYFENDFEKYKDLIFDIKQYITKIYIQYKDIFKKKNTADVFSKQINTFLENQRCKEKLELIMQEFEENKNYEILAEISQTWNILINTLEKMNMVMQDYEISIEQYKKMLYNALNTQKIAIIPPTIDRVIIMDMQRSKSLGYKVLFILGMNDTLLPRTFKKDIIFQDEDKYIMKDYDINLNSTSLNLLSQEKTAIYMILSKAGEKIYLSYALTDVNMQSSGKSSYIHTIQNIFPKLKEEYISKLSFYEKNSIYEDNMTIKAVFEKLRTDLRDMLKDNNISKDTLRLYKFFKEEKDFEEKVSSLKKSLFIKNNIKKIDYEYIQKIYNLPLSSSISQIQNYARCPFSYYMNYGIRPQKRQNSNIDNTTTGSILHRYMEKFSNEILEKNDMMLLDTKQKIEDFVDKIYQDEEFLGNDINIITSNSKRQKNIIDNLKKISKKATKIIVEQKSSSSFITQGTELKIKDLKLKLYNDKHTDNSNSDMDYILLKGVVDRVDKLEKDKIEYIQVIDYKSSVKKLDFKDVYQGINIQLIFYLYALTDKEDKKPYCAMYFPMIDSKVLISDDNIDKLEEKLREQMKMSGIITDDLEILKKFENDIQDKSKFLDVKLKDSEVKGSSVVSKEDMNLIMKHTIDIIKESAKSILDGVIEPKPVKNACTYCDYKNICGFDESVKGFEYKKLPNVKKNQVFDMLKQKYSNQEKEKKDE